MTSFAPASTSIGAEISPVWAPKAAAWQSWPPTTMPPAGGTVSGMRGKGGQTATSTPGASRAAAAIAESSARAARLPFHFQLPATSLRRTGHPDLSFGPARLATPPPPAKLAGPGRAFYDPPNAVFRRILHALLLPPRPHGQ